MSELVLFSQCFTVNTANLLTHAFRFTESSSYCVSVCVYMCVHDCNHKADKHFPEEQQLWTRARLVFLENRPSAP